MMKNIIFKYSTISDRVQKHLLNKYAYCTTYLFTFAFLLCWGCTSPSYIGHWKCDKTGTCTIDQGNGNIENISITELYDTFKTEPAEIEFTADGRYIEYQRLKNGTHNLQEENYFPNYQGDPNKIRVHSTKQVGSQQIEKETIITINNITAQVLELRVEDDDDMTYHLKMNRIN